jgi:hypothetical protein
MGIIDRVKRKPSINRDIRRLKKQIRKNKNVDENEIIKNTLHEINKYYKASKLDLKFYLKRLEYLKYNRGMGIGIASGFVASIITIILTWTTTKFGPSLTESLIASPSILQKMVIYFGFIFVLAIIVLFPCFIGIKTLILYCFHVFFDEKQSYFDDYEIEILQKHLVKRTLINHDSIPRLMTGYQPTMNRRGSKTRLANSRY